MSPAGDDAEGSLATLLARDFGRNERAYITDKPADARSNAQRDRDRILYSPGFRRLADVTQVVPANEGPVFHNRLTHSLEVAQFGRRLAEKLVKENPALADRVGGIDPDVVEAACLAHDIGHPPFGHVAEEELNHLVTEGAHLRSGFEGNAQSFRVVTKLALHPPCPQGLNLTRATLNALMKYPWLRDTPRTSWLKWGAYDTEIMDLRNVRKSSISPEKAIREEQWAKQFSTERELKRGELDWPSEHSFLRDISKSNEAMLMDWADDVTYAVHDAVDFYCAGLIPLDRLNSQKDDSERRRFFDEVFDRHQKAGLEAPYERPVLEQSFQEIILEFPNIGPYEGTQQQRANLVNHTSVLIKRYIEGVQLDPSGKTGQKVQIDREHKMEVFMLKQLTWRYVIMDSRLATHQHGQCRIIRDLFNMYAEAAIVDKARTVFPLEVRDRLEKASKDHQRFRIVADFISAMGESQALNLHRRLIGISPGAALAPVVV